MPRGWLAVFPQTRLPAVPITSERSSSYCAVHSMMSSFADSIVSGVFFLLPQPPQDTPRMCLDATALRQRRRQILALEHPAGLLDSLDQSGHRFVGELVGPLRPALAWQQPRQALALEQLLRGQAQFPPKAFRNITANSPLPRDSTDGWQH